MIVACENAKSVLRRAAIDPSERKTLNITLSAAVAAAYLDRTPEGLAKAEARGRLPAPRSRPTGGGSIPWPT
jgi:chromosome partitioning protein